MQLVDCHGSTGRPLPGQAGPTARVRQDAPNFGRIRVNFGRTRAESGSRRPYSARVGSMSGRSRPNLARILVTVEVGQTWPNSGHTWPNAGAARGRPNLDRIPAIVAELGLKAVRLAPRPVAPGQN